MPLCLVAGLVSLACTATQNTAAPQTSEMPSEVTGDPKIQNALSAAPTGIATDAAVMDFPATPGGPMVELRKGTNGWTCLPDVPDSPANDPMCMDKNAMQWADAWMSKKTPALSGTGIGYMLQGGATADNDDPFAKTPKAGKNWLMEPPHLMVFGTKLDPTVHSNQPNTTQPWVMWKGTPYEHLMVPVK
jgi:hypothetical protein